LDKIDFYGVQKTVSKILTSKVICTKKLKPYQDDEAAEI